MKPAPSLPPGASPDPVELLRSRSYLALLVFGAIIGVPVATAAYFFLKGVDESQHYLFETLPGELGFDGEPMWWPLPLLVLSGLIVAIPRPATCPGRRSCDSDSDVKASGPVPPIELPGIVIAAFATLRLGAGLGPEAPLIATAAASAAGGAPVKRDAPAQAGMVICAAGSFAAISTLLGSPIVGAFLMMEVSGLGGPMLGVVLVPGLLAAGVGSLIFVGLAAWTGFWHVFARRPRHSARRHARRRQVPLGARNRRRRRRTGYCDPHIGPPSQAHRRTPERAPHTGRRPSGRGAGDRLRRGIGQELLGSALLRPGRTPVALANAETWTAGPRAAHRVHGPRLQRLLEAASEVAPLLRPVPRASGGIALSHLPGLPMMREPGWYRGTADLQRDLGGAIMQSIFGALLTAGYAAAAGAAVAASGKNVNSSVQAELTKSFSSALRHRVAVSDVGSGQHHRFSEDCLPPRRPVGLPRRDRRRAARGNARLLHVPEARGGKAAARPLLRS